jgi:predicted nucleic acid-binding protein
MQQKVYLETEAKLFIQDKIRKGKFRLVWSYILDYENTANPNEDARSSIQKWENISSHFVLESQILVESAKSILGKGFGVKDSIHIACAIESKAQYFFTVDNGILKRRNLISEIRIINPVEFIAMEEEI